MFTIPLKDKSYMQQYTRNGINWEPKGQTMEEIAKAQIEDKSASP